jgi:putative inorganic carbon (hco3(-)) transporter
MGPALAVGAAAPKAGIVLAALAAAGVLLDRGPRRRCAWMVLALGLAAVILIDHIADTDQWRSLTDNGLRFGALCAAAVLAVALLASVLVRRPNALPVWVVAVLPFRVPVEAAGTTSNLLVPLYLVIAAGCVAFTWRTFRERQPARDDAARPLTLALALFLVLYGLQALYSKDFDTALEQVVFFFVPFALLYALLREVQWTRDVVLACLGVLVALALVFCAIGFWEYDRRELFWNPKVIAANQFESYFRVNSVFWDPNVYGRFLALVMTAAAAFLLWTRRPGIALGTGAVLAVLWGGLVLTFSQSSFAALLAGLAVLAALRWDVRRTAVAAVAGVALAAVIAVAFQDTLKIDLGSSSGLTEVTSGRSDLIGGGLELFVNRPLQGYGSGSFGRAYRQERKGNQQQAVSASHTMPVTVAAEQGVIGLVAYLAVVAAALMVLFGDRAARALPAGRGLRVARAALAAMFVALLVHTMVYAAFLEDPFTWVIIAAGAALAPLAKLREETVRVTAPGPEAVPATT